MRRWFLAVALACAACGDNNTPEPFTPTPDGPPVDTGPVGPLAPCLDQPGDLPAAPNGGLSCDLLPPGFTAP